jgi:hypothetical protein
MSTESEERQQIINLLKECIQHMDILNQHLAKLYPMDDGEN